MWRKRPSDDRISLIDEASRQMTVNLDVIPSRWGLMFIEVNRKIDATCGQHHPDGLLFWFLLSTETIRGYKGNKKRLLRGGENIISISNWLFSSLPFVISCFLTWYANIRLNYWKYVGLLKRDGGGSRNRNRNKTPAHWGHLEQHQSQEGCEMSSASGGSPGGRRVEGSATTAHIS